MPPILLYTQAYAAWRADPGSGGLRPEGITWDCPRQLPSDHPPYGHCVRRRHQHPPRRGHASASGRAHQPR